MVIDLSLNREMPILNRILELIPEHKIYCELLGDGNILAFNKNASETEIVNIANPNTAFIYNFIKNLTPEQINELKKFNWKPNKDYSSHLKKTKPKTDIDRFHSLIYCNAGIKNDVVDILVKLKERIKKTIINNQNFLKTIDKYDSPETFFYINLEGSEDINTKDLKAQLKGIKGKFILTANLPDDLFSDFTVKKLKLPEEFENEDRILVANYEISDIQLSTLDFVRDLKSYDPSKVGNRPLADDWRIITAWYSTKKTKPDGIKYSMEEIVNTAKLIFDEITARVKAGKMMHTFEPDKMKPHAKELFEKVSKGKEIPFARQMTIKVLGTGPTDPIVSEKIQGKPAAGKTRRLQSSVLIDNKLLIDCTPSLDEQMKGLRPKIEAVLITHAHKDAIDGLREIEKYAAETPLPVYSLPHTIDLIKKAIAKTDHLDFHKVNPYENIKVAGLSATPFPVEHSVLQPKFDPTVSWKVGSMVYAEDVDEDFFLSAKANRLKDAMKKAKVVFLDGAMCKGRLKGHINIWNVVSHLKNYGIDNIYWIQVGRSCPLHEELEKQLSHYAPPTFKVAYDGMELRAPLSFAQTKHIYLTEPHAELAWEDNKTLIVKARDYPHIVDMPLILTDKNYEYGVIRLRPGTEMNRQQFKEMQHRHKVTDEEAMRWWGERDKLYSFEFEWLDRYENPKPSKVPKGTQTFFDMDFSRMDMNMVLKHFRDMTIIDRFISLAGSFIDKQGKGYNDMDFIVRLSPPNDFIRRAIESRFDKDLPKEISDKVHIVFDPEGPHSKHIPLYNLALKRTADNELIKMALQSVKPLQAYLPQKPYGSAYYKIEDIMSQIKDGIEYSVEKKLNGFHVTVHKKGDEVKIFSEEKKDLTDSFPTLVKAIKGLSGKDFIVDGELVPYKDGEALGRNELMKFLGKEKADDSRIKLHIWDIIYYGGDTDGAG